jgi:hypothetical protein
MSHSDKKGKSPTKVRPMTQLLAVSCRRHIKSITYYDKPCEIEYSALE